MDYKDEFLNLIQDMIDRTVNKKLSYQQSQLDELRAERDNLKSRIATLESKPEFYMGSFVEHIYDPPGVASSYMKIIGEDGSEEEVESLNPTATLSTSAKNYEGNKVLVIKIGGRKYGIVRSYYPQRT